MTKRVAIYCRVSTDGQTIDNQIEDLQLTANRHGWNVVEIIKDVGISGAKSRKERPGLDKLYKGIARKQYDIVAAWSVDRLGRSLIDLIDFLQTLNDKNIELYLHKQGIDTSTAHGSFVFKMMGLFAEFERDMIRERVKCGLARAKKEGKVFGRPKVPSQIVDAILAARSNGWGMIKIAKSVGCGVGTVQRVLKDTA